MKINNKKIIYCFLFLIFISCVKGEIIYEEKFSFSYPSEKDYTLNLKNVNGNIEITGWDSLKIEISGVKKGYGKSEKEAKKFVEETKIDIKKEENNYIIITESPGFKHGNAKVDYKILLPFDSKLKIKSVNSNVKVERINGEIHIEIVNGNVKLEGGGDEIYISTINGNIEVFKDTLTSPLYVSTINGNINSDFPIKGEKDARIKLKSINGNISILKIKKGGVL